MRLKLIVFSLNLCGSPYLCVNHGSSSQSHRGPQSLHGGLSNLQQITSRIAYIEARCVRSWASIGNDLDAGFAKSFFGSTQIRNRETNVARARVPHAIFYR